MKITSASARFTALAVVSVISVAATSCGDTHATDAVPADSRASASWDAQGVEISTGGFLGVGVTQALAYFPRGIQPRGAIVMSPGAKIPAESMADLAGGFVKEGYAVYVLKYLGNLPIVPTEHGKALFLAGKLQDAAGTIKGLPSDLVTAHKAGKIPVSIFGHSMGGAVLGSTLGNAKSADLKAVVLFGVSKLVNNPEGSKAKVSLLTGSKDGLVDEKELATMEKVLGVKSNSVAGVNHFCVVADSNVGDKGKRALDEVAELASGGCVDAVVKASIAAGI